MAAAEKCENAARLSPGCCRDRTVNIPRAPKGGKPPEAADAHGTQAK